MITYVQGDVTNPIETPAIIAHVVNDVGLFGAGVAAAIANKYPAAQQDYFQWFGHKPLKQGDIKFSNVTGLLDSDCLVLEACALKGIWVCHMVSQVGTVSKENPQPFKLESLDKCLASLAKTLESIKVIGRFTPSLHFPRIGMGLGGWQDWSAIEAVIEKHLASYEVFVYDLAD